MRKRGAHVRHRAKAIPGLVAQRVTANYETRLRMSVEAVRGGWATAAHFNDLADTVDMLRIGLVIYPAQRPDPSAQAAADLALVAMENIKQRHADTGRFGATGEEMKALQLLVDVALDFWNRRSGALFAEARRQMINARYADAAAVEES